MNEGSSTSLDVEIEAEDRRSRIMESNPDRIARADYAVLYARLGFYVFPCKRDKAPLTRHGHADAAMDVARVAHWWNRWPDANIGIACGPSRIVVLDYDANRDETGASLSLLRTICQGIQTVCAWTGSGGLHIYFRHRGGPPFGCTVGRVAPKIDVRAIGGYVIAPPSANERGAYKWATDIGFDLLPKYLNNMAELPS